MIVTVKGTVGEIVNDGKYSWLFTVNTEDGDKLIMSARKDIPGINMTPGAAHEFMCDIYGSPRQLDGGKEIYRNHINVKSILSTTEDNFQQMHEAFHAAREKMQRRAKA